MRDRQSYIWCGVGTSLDILQTTLEFHRNSLHANTLQYELLNLTKTSIVSLLPTLIADTRRAPQNVLWVDLALNLLKALVIGAPECLLPVLLEW